jgi:hypothetical protein
LTSRRTTAWYSRCGDSAGSADDARRFGADGGRRRTSGVGEEEAAWAPLLRGEEEATVSSGLAAAPGPLTISSSSVPPFSSEPEEEE